MDTLLKIQVRVMAREAAAELRKLGAAIRTVQNASARGSSRSPVEGMSTSLRLSNAELSKINRGLAQFGRSSSIGSATAEAKKYNQQLITIQRNLNSVGAKKPWQTPATGSSAPVDIRKGRADAERSAAQAQALAQRQASQASVQAARQQQQYMKQVWQQQVRDARAAAQAQAQAQRQASQSATQAGRQQQQMMKQVWQQQVRDARAAAQAQAQAQRQASQAATQAGRQQQQMMKQVWQQQVRDGRTAAQAQAQSQRQATQAANQAARQQQQMMKQVWQQQVRDARDAARQQAAAARDSARQQAQAARDLAKQQGVAARDAAKLRIDYEKKVAAAVKAADTAAKTAATVHAPFAAGAMQQLDSWVNGAMPRARMSMIQFGKNLQWVGRQINFNFTLPIIGAAKYAMGWALENEAAFTRLKKVYGDSGKDYTDVLAKIRYGMELLSNIYGVTQGQVMELAAQWAAAGATGGDLAKSVETSLKLNVLGDYKDLGRVFEDLITIQGAFRMSSEELSTAIALLNTTENMTAATLPDLVTGIAKAGGTAQMAGVSIQELAAMMAVLVPATGSAANAGNALKTIFSRLMAPTKDTIEVLRLMGVEFESTAFQSLTVTDRLKLLADKFTGLSDAQQAYASSVVGSRWQVNKFAVLMKDLADQTGTYQKVLEALSPANMTKNWQAANKEIQTLLESSPQRIQIIATQMKNMAADIIQPLIPVFAGLAATIGKFLQWFSSLNPQIQTGTFVVLGLTVAVGILSQMVGSFMLLFGQTGQFVLGFFRLLGVGIGKSAAQVAAATAANNAVMAESALVSAAASYEAVLASTTATAESVAIAEAALAELTIASEVASAQAAAAAAAAPAAVSIGAIAAWGALIGMMAGFLWIFRDDIAKAAKSVWDFIEPLRNGIASAFNNIKQVMVDAFNALPASVQNALLAVAKIVEKAVTIIRDWLSYLNPFARHSPSLVDNVKAGTQVIAKEYYNLAQKLAFLAQSQKDLSTFEVTVAPTMERKKQAERTEQKSNILLGTPNAGPNVDALYRDLDNLNSVMKQLNEQIKAQEAVVAPLKQAYDDASRAVDAFEAQMAPLALEVNRLEKEMDKAKGKINELASTPITGMKAMSDAIFDNEMAQKKLRLEMLKMEQAGNGYQSLQERIGALNGDIETARASMTDLRDAGAGSDVLGVYQDQIAALESQKAGLEDSAQAALDLQKQLDDLQTAGEILSLEQSVNFDPLIKQIDDLANAQKEMDFDTIISGIKEQKDKLDDLTAAYEPQKAALDAQQEALDKLIYARDLAKAGYDAEAVKLQALTDEYKKFEDQVRAIEEALKAAEEAAQALTSGGGGGGGGGDSGLWDALGAGNFPDNPLPTFGDSLNLDEMIKEWEGQMSGIFDFDPFGGLRDWWKKAQDWWVGSAVPWIREHMNIGGIIAGAIAGFMVGGPLGALIGAPLGGLIGDAIMDAIHAISSGEVASGVTGALGSAFDSIYGFIQTSFIEPVSSILKDLPFQKEIGSAFDWLVNTLPGWFDDAWSRIKTFFSDIWNGISGFSELWDPLVEAAGHVWNVMKDIGGVIEWVMKAVIVVATPVIGALITVFMGLWRVISNTLGPAFKMVGEVINAVLDIIKNVIKFVLSIINGDWGDAWDALMGVLVGAWDLVFAFLRGIGGIILGILEGLWDTLWQVGSYIIEGLWNGLTTAASAVWDFFMSLPAKIATFLVRAASWLVNAGGDILDGLGEGVARGFIAVTTWFQALPGRIATFLGNAVNWLLDGGRRILVGLAEGIVRGYNAVVDWFQALPDRIATFLGNAVNWLMDGGREILAGLAEGIVRGYNAVVDWFRALPGRVSAFFSNAGTWLFDIGKKIINGLWDGLKDMWNDVTGWLGDVGGWIVDLKGPPEKDAELLVENGRLIMQGLHEGMKDGWSDIESYLKTRGIEIEDEFRGNTKLFEDITKDVLSGIARVGDEYFRVGANGETQIVSITEAMYDNITAAGWMKGALSEIDKERKAIQIKGDFDDLNRTIWDNAVAVNEGSKTAQEANDDNRLAVLSLKEEVMRYGEQVLQLPASQMTSIQALLDQGKYDEAKLLLQNLEKDRTTKLKIDPEFAKGGTGSFQVHWMARGGIINKPTLAGVGEAGPEVVIPLTNATRARQLMRDSGLLNLASTMMDRPSQSMVPTASKTENTIVINGDLSFPNIKTGEDAERFISNLEMLAGV